MHATTFIWLSLVFLAGQSWQRPMDNQYQGGGSSGSSASGFDLDNQSVSPTSRGEDRSMMSGYTCHPYIHVYDRVQRAHVKLDSKYYTSRPLLDTLIARIRFLMTERGYTADTFTKSTPQHSNDLIDTLTVKLRGIDVDPVYKEVTKFLVEVLDVPPQTVHTIIGARKRRSTVEKRRKRAALEVSQGGEDLHYIHNRLDDDVKQEIEDEMISMGIDLREVTLTRRPAEAVRLTQKYIDVSGPRHAKGRAHNLKKFLCQRLGKRRNFIAAMDRHRANPILYPEIHDFLAEEDREDTDRQHTDDPIEEIRQIMAVHSPSGSPGATRTRRQYQHYSDLSQSSLTSSNEDSGMMRSQLGHANFFPPYPSSSHSSASGSNSMPPGYQRVDRLIEHTQHNPFPSYDLSPLGNLMRPRHFTTRAATSRESQRHMHFVSASHEQHLRQQQSSGIMPNVDPSSQYQQPYSDPTDVSASTNLRPAPATLPPTHEHSNRHD